MHDKAKDVFDKANVVSKVVKETSVSIDVPTEVEASSKGKVDTQSRSTEMALLEKVGEEVTDELSGTIVVFKEKWTKVSKKKKKHGTEKEELVARKMSRVASKVLILGHDSQA